MKNSTRGTTLIEILVAASILGLVMTSIVAIVTLSVKNIAESKARAVAVKYGQEGMELFRRERDSLGWESFIKTLTNDGAGVGGGVLHYCLPTIPNSSDFQTLTGGACSFSDTAQFVDSRDIFQRQVDVTLTQTGTLVDANVTVTVKWYEGANVKSSSVSQKFEQNLNYTVQPATVFDPAVPGSPLPGWKYRRAITINNSAFGSTVQTDFQVPITLNTSSLIPAKMKAACEDMRVTASDGITLLPYWIETGSGGCATASTVIWTKVSSIPVGSTTIYVYYGNAAAASAQNGSSVFPFLDEFNTLDTARWGISTTQPSGVPTVSGGEVTISRGSLYTKSALAVPGVRNYFYEYRIRWPNFSAANYSGLEIANAIGTQDSNTGGNALAYFMSPQGGGSAIQAWANGTGVGYGIVGGATQFTATANTNYIDAIVVTSSSVQFYHNRSLTGSYAGTWSAVPYLYMGMFLGANSGNIQGNLMTVDWVLARKYASPTPIPTVGAEEAFP